MDKTLKTFRSVLLSEQSELSGKLEKLRADGKEKTVTYRELLAQKLIVNSTLEKLDTYLKPQKSLGQGAD